MPYFRHLLIAFLLVLAAPSTAAAASSLAITAPATAKLGSTVTITYRGLAQSADGSNMKLAGFRELDGATCAPNGYDQGGRLYSRSAGRFSAAPGPFSISAKVEFLATGTWRICAYLNNAADFLDSPPAAFATATITITTGQPAGVSGCKVPKLRGLTVTKARAALKRARCALGRVKRTRAASGKPLGSLVVVKQEFKTGTRLPRGRPIDVTAAPKRS